jgi:hypothetical protein
VCNLVDVGVPGNPERERKHGGVDGKRHRHRPARPLSRFLEEKSNFRRCVYSEVTHVLEMRPEVLALDLFCSLILERASCKTGATGFLIPNPESLTPGI